MASAGPGEIWTNYQYSSSSGSTTQVAVIWNSFSIGVFDTVNNIQPITVSTSLQVNSQGASSGGAQSSSRSVSIWLNGVQVLVGADAFGTAVYNCTGPVTTIRVALSAFGNSFIALGPDRTGGATASFDYTVTINNIATTSDFVLIKNTSTVFLQLPPVAGNISKPIFIKNTGTGRTIRVYTYQTECNITDIGQPMVYFTADYGCLTLVSDGTKWFIANFYPSNNQGYLPISTATITDTDKIALSAKNIVNIFNTDVVPGNPGNTDRQTGDNLVYLPGSLTEPALCVVAYVGSTSGGGRQSGNALSFVSPTSNTNIDGNPGYTAANRPAILTNVPQASTGIVFIADVSPIGLADTTWYIAGYFNSPSWQFNDPDGGYWPIPSVPRQALFIIAPGTNRFYSLPNDSVVPRLFSIIKTQTVINNGVRFSANSGVGVNGPNKINDTTSRIYYVGNQTNSCIWFMSEQRSGENFLRYYPILAYTPN
jgi:hypothetical protein